MNGCTRLALGAAMIALAVASSACSSTSTCSRDADQIDVDGWVNEDRTMFSSADPDKLPLLDGGKLPDGVPGPVPSFTHFPANRTITFHVRLRAIPLDINPLLSFSPDGDATVAPCAGNQCLIRKRTKDVVVLHNDTCSEFYVWLTASTSATPFHELTDAGVDDGAADSDSTGAAGASGEP